MEAPIYYIVKAKFVKKEKGREPEFEEYQKVIKNDAPIIARQEAFHYYQSIVEVLLQNKGKEYYSDQQARQELISFIERDELSKVTIGEKEVVFTSDSLGNGVGVYLVVSESLNFCPFTPIDKGDHVILHGIGNFASKYQVDKFVCFLRSEADCYQQLNLDTSNDLTEIVYCMRSAWEDGCDDVAIEQFQILKTPFDWDGLDKPYWWGFPDTNIEHVDSSILPTFQDILKEGESNKVEFKPTLLYNFKTLKAGIGIKEINARAVCAFLNGKGGFLFIGVDDDGSAQGLDKDFELSQGKKPKDFFRLEFDQMIEHFLGFACKSNISGNFFDIDGKDVFVVTIEPSSRPVFLNSQGEKRFYVRGEASSRQLRGVEEILAYCLDRFAR